MKIPGDVSKKAIKQQAKGNDEQQESTDKSSRDQDNRLVGA
jgi:hypothetical protein